VKYTGAIEYDADSWWRFQLCNPFEGGSCLGKDFGFYDYIDVNPGKLVYSELKTKIAHYRVESLDGYGLMGVQIQYHDRAGYSATTVRHAGKRTGEIFWRANFEDTPERK
jgi:hypothetical protein